MFALVYRDVAGYHFAMFRVVTVRLILLIAASFGSGATVPLSAQNTLPPDQQAYQSAWLKADPQQQIDALTKVAVDYPSSRYAERARMGALRVLVKVFPSRSADISRRIDQMLKGEKASDPGPYDNVATVLVDAGVMLERAKSLSEKTVKAFKEAEFVATLKREYAEAKMPPVDDARLQSIYRTARADLLGTLGRVYFKQGKLDQARKIFEEAERDRSTATAAGGLGRIAFKEGREDVAYDYFLRARLTGVLARDDERAFEAMFAKRHAGDGTSLPAMLDAEYRRLFPNPIRVEPYRPSGPTTARTALLEVFTGAGCPPCAGADLAVDAVRERYSPRDVVVLMHHIHIPLPDPMTNPDTVARADFYSVQFAPTYVVDGSNKQTDGSAREDALRPYDRLTAMIEEALKESPHARLSATAILEGAIVKVHADVSEIDGPVDNLTLRIVLVERELRYGGENGIRFHPMVVRALAEFPIDRSKNAGVTTQFEVDGIEASLKRYLDDFEQRNDRFGPITFVEKMFAVDAADLGVVVFIQNEKDHRVLQSMFTAVGTNR